MFKWCELYEVGIAEVDRQHKKIFELAEAIHQIIITRPTHEVKLELDKIYDELIAYTLYHFQYEEELMRQANYNNLETHMLEHKNLIIQINELKQEASTLRFETELIELLDLLSRWIFNHILGSDFKYVHTLISHSNQV